MLTFHSLFFFFNDTATTELYTLSLHDALPIFSRVRLREVGFVFQTHNLIDDLTVEENIALPLRLARKPMFSSTVRSRSEEHTSELQSPDHLVCRLLLEKKKNTQEISGDEHRG